MDDHNIAVLSCRLLGRHQYGAAILQEEPSSSSYPSLIFQCLACGYMPRTKHPSYGKQQPFQLVFCASIRKGQHTRHMCQTGFSSPTSERCDLHSMVQDYQTTIDLLCRKYSKFTITS